ncbi:MAG: DNA primase [Parcubacteria group bacterium]
MSDTVDEIKQKLDIVTVVGEYVPLRKAGASWKARCPFHNEKTPSFIVNSDRQSWHCFGCNEGGDMFTFVEKMEGCEFVEAMKILANKAGVQLKKFDAKTADRRSRLLEICDRAAEHWQLGLNSPAGQKAAEYLLKRKVSVEAQKQFQLGYAVDSWDDLLGFLLKQGFTETEVFQAGLVVKKEKGTGYYDRFRDRLMFPITDLHGQIVGFTGRTMKSDEQAKYVNTPESELYHKGKVLYALDKAKQAIRKQNYVVVVEGNMDALTCHQFGYLNVVACSGTAMTAEQIALIKRYTENVALCFDQDSAGQEAARRTIDLLQAAEMNTKIVQIISGKDPDECLKNNPADWVASLKNAKLVMQFYFDHFLTPEALANIGKKKVAAKAVLTEIAKIKNRIEQEHWLKKLAIILEVPEDALRSSLPRSAGVGHPTKKASEIEPVNPIKPKEQQYLELLLTILLNHPSLIAYSQEYLSPEMIILDDYAAFYKQLIIYYNGNQATTSSDLHVWLGTAKQPFGPDYLDALILYVNSAYEDFGDGALKQELIQLISLMRRHYWDHRIHQKERELASAKSGSQLDKEKELLKDIQWCIGEKGKLL